MIADVEKIFDEALDSAFKTKPEVLKFVKTHGRKRICLENICGAISHAEKRKYSISLELKTYKQIIRDYARLFAKAALEHHEQKNWTEAQRHAARRKIDRIADAEGLAIELGIIKKP